MPLKCSGHLRIDILLMKSVFNCLLLELEVRNLLNDAITKYLNPYFSLFVQLSNDGLNS